MALTHDRANPYINPSDFPGEEYQVAALGSSFAGGMVGLNSSGYLDKLPSGNTIGFRFRGLSHRNWANPTETNGAFITRVDRPHIMQGLKVLAGDPVLPADLGNVVYGADDETIAKTDGGGTLCEVGILQKINLDGTVDVKPLEP